MRGGDRQSESSFIVQRCLYFSLLVNNLRDPIFVFEICINKLYAVHDINLNSENYSKFISLIYLSIHNIKITFCPIFI